MSVPETTVFRTLLSLHLAACETCVLKALRKQLRCKEICVIGSSIWLCPAKGV